MCKALMSNHTLRTQCAISHNQPGNDFISSIDSSWNNFNSKIGIQYSIDSAVDFAFSSLYCSVIPVALDSVI